MRTRALIFTLTLFCAIAAFGQNFSGGTITRQDASGSIAGATAGIRDGWIAWRVAAATNGRICCYDGKSGCCGCSLNGSHGLSINVDDEHPQGKSTEMVVAIELDGGAPRHVRIFDAGCAVAASGATIHWLDNVRTSDSVDYLTAQARRGTSEGEFIAAIALHSGSEVETRLEELTRKGEREDVREQAIFWIGQTGRERGARFLRDFLHSDAPLELRKKAVFSLSQNKADGALTELIALARNDQSSELRREAIFWLGQRAGAKAAAELQHAVDEDPDDDVREHAVFAISQLPKDQSIPMLIDLAKHNKHAGVREKAVFWLGQSGDPRALALIEDILTH